MHEAVRRRLARLCDGNGHSIIGAADHAVSSGPLPGIEKIDTSIRTIWEGCDALLLNRGIAQCGLLPEYPPRGLIVSMSGGTNYDRLGRKAVIGSVEDALRLGADCVAYQLMVGDHADRHALKDLGVIASSCTAWNVPLLVMAYAAKSSSDRDEKVTHAARAAAELGADLVKVPILATTASTLRLRATCAAPLLLAGGELHGDFRRCLDKIEEAMSAEFQGVCIGRNIFQGSRPLENLTAISRVVRDGWTSSNAYSWWLNACRSTEGALGVEDTTSSIEG